MNYAGFIRGIGPGDPAKSNASLIKVFESLGYGNVRAFISSGNILFETDEQNADELERTIEHALTKQLGFEAAVLVRSKPELETFVARRPFGERTHSRESYLIVTFLKTETAKGIDLTKVPEGKGYENLGYDKELRALCSVVDTTISKTPDFMAGLERAYGKAITTRTFNTIQRVTAKL